MQWVRVSNAQLRSKRSPDTAQPLFAGGQPGSLSVLPEIRPECARHESKPTHKQDQNHEWGPDEFLVTGVDASVNFRQSAKGSSPGRLTKPAK